MAEQIKQDTTKDSGINISKIAAEQMMKQFEAKVNAAKSKETLTNLQNYQRDIVRLLTASIGADLKNERSDIEAIGQKWILAMQIGFFQMPKTKTNPLTRILSKLGSW